MLYFEVSQCYFCWIVLELNFNANSCGIWSKHILCLLLCKRTVWCKWTAVNSKFYSHSWALSEVKICWTSKAMCICRPCANKTWYVIVNIDTFRCCLFLHCWKNCWFFVAFCGFLSQFAKRWQFYRIVNVNTLFFWTNSAVCHGTSKFSNWNCRPTVLKCLYICLFMWF